MSITIQPATSESDLELIQELAYEIWPSYYSSIISLDQIEYMLRTIFSIETMQQQFSLGMLFFLVVENEKPIGFIGLSHRDENSLYIEKLYLLAETRGKGYGKQMIEFTRKLAKEKKNETIMLNVNRFNEALRFYKSLGFTVSEQVDIPFGPYVLNDFVMRMPLSYS